MQRQRARERTERGLAAPEIFRGIFSETVRRTCMTSSLLPMSRKEKEARLAAQAAEKEAYRRAKDLHRSEDSATRIACVAYERTYRNVIGAVE